MPYILLFKNSNDNHVKKTKQKDTEKTHSLTLIHTYTYITTLVLKTHSVTDSYIYLVFFRVYLYYYH